MRVFKPGDEFRFDLKAPDKIGTVGVFGENGFNGDRALEQRLIGAINDAKSARADLLV